MYDSEIISEAPLRVACLQMRPNVGEKAANLTRSEELIREAASAGAQLVVLPELANSGYVFQTRDEAFEMSETVPGGETCELWESLAKLHDITIVAGICERENSALYNSAVTIAPSGYIGTYRKVHLWDNEALFFEPGNLGFPVFTTDLGRIASFICYDCWFAEVFRCCALKGADILCVPTNWVPIPGQREDREAMANIIVMAAAHTNSVFVAAADRVGTERGQLFIGQSLIVSYTGWPIAGPASTDEEEIIYADINLADARKRRTWNDFNHILRDRRPEVYNQEVLEPGLRR